MIGIIPESGMLIAFAGIGTTLLRAFSYKTFVCRLDEDQLVDAHVVSLILGECANCGLVVPNSCLVDVFCEEQIAEKGEEILQGFGIANTRNAPETG